MIGVLEGFFDGTGQGLHMAHRTNVSHETKRHDRDRVLTVECSGGSCRGKSVFVTQKKNSYKRGVHPTERKLLATRHGRKERQRVESSQRIGRLKVRRRKGLGGKRNINRLTTWSGYSAD